MLEMILSTYKRLNGSHLSGFCPGTAKSKCLYLQEIYKKHKVLNAQSKQTETLQKCVKATIYTQILIFDSYLKQVELERTSGNTGRHRGEVHILAGRLLGWNKWLRLNKSKVDTDKCNFNTFSLKEKFTLPPIQVDSYFIFETDQKEFLGVIIDKSLIFKAQASLISSKTSNQLACFIVYSFIYFLKSSRRFAIAL